MTSESIKVIIMSEAALVVLLMDEELAIYEEQNKLVL
jgi:hypothetical protein